MYKIGDACDADKQLNVRGKKDNLRYQWPWYEHWNVSVQNRNITFDSSFIMY